MTAMFRPAPSIIGVISNGERRRNLFLLAPSSIRESGPSSNSPRPLLGNIRQWYNCPL